MRKLTNMVLTVSFISLLGATCYKANDATVAEVNINAPVNTNLSNMGLSDLPTYTNDRYKFSFQYPSDWTVEASEADTERNGLTQILGVYGPNNRGIAFFITQVDEFSELKTRIEQSDVLADGTSLAQISQQQEILIDGRTVTKAQQATALGIPEDIYYVELENGNFLFISSHNFDDNSVAEGIINSLRFTGDWLTYTSEDLGFSFSYPRSWNVDDTETDSIKVNSAGTQLEIEAKGTVTSDVQLNIFSDRTKAPYLSGGDFQNGLQEAQTSGLISGLSFTNTSTAQFTEYNEFLDQEQQHVYFLFPSGNLVTGTYISSHPEADVIESIFESFDAEEDVGSGAEDMSEWLTYTDDLYNFTFRYPKSWGYAVPRSGDEQGRGYLDPIGFNEDYNLVTLRMDLLPYQQILDIEPTEWMVIKRETQTVNGVEITHEVGEAPRNLGTENYEVYTYNSYIISVDESKTLTFFLSDDEEEYVGVVEETLNTLSNPGWALYSNEDLGLRFMYPEEWDLTHVEGGTDFIDVLDNNDIYEHQLVNVHVRWSSRHEDIVSKSGLVVKSLDQWLDCSNTYEQVSCSSVVIDGVGMIKREGKVKPPFGDSYVALAFKQGNFTVFIDARSLLREVSSGEPGNENLDGLEYINAVLETVRVD